MPAAMRMAAGAILLLSLLPVSAAQMPEQAGSAAFSIVLTCPETLLEPRYAGQDDADCVLKNLSRDAVYLPEATSGTGAIPHTVTFSSRPSNLSANASGWQVQLSEATRSFYGGDQIPLKVTVKATPVIDVADYFFDVIAEYTAPGGYTQIVSVPFSAQVAPYGFALVSWAGAQAQKAGQDEVVVYTVSVQNSGVYPDNYRFTITADPDLRVSVPPSLYVPAGETRTANITVLTPHNKIYEIGRSTALGIKVTSMGVAGLDSGGVYSTTAILNIRGAYVPAYWIPLFLVGLTSATVLARGTNEKLEQRRLEKGRPRRVEVTPRQAVLLAELKRTDPDTYKEKRAALDSVYRERVADYRDHRKERLAADREEARQAKAEFKAAKQARKAAKKEERRQAAIAAKAAQREAKLAKKAAKKEAKLLKKKEKVLAKARAKLEKAQAKQAKIDAKQAAKDAKIAAKEAKAAAKAEKQAARAAKKQEK